MPGHWVVIMIINLPSLLTENKDAYILYLDSLGVKIKSIIEAVREYLRCELMDKQRADPKKVMINSVTLPEYQLLLPRQTNFHDCGLHMILNVESLLLSPHILFQDFKIIENRKQLTLYPRSLSFTIRFRIMDLLISYKRSQTPEQRK